jgi:dipeptidase E
MKNLFLSSYFSGAAKLLPSFAGDLVGKKLTFIPTASLPEKVDFYVDADKKALVKLGLLISDLEISSASQADIATRMDEADILFVEGGNTFFLLQELKRTGTDERIVEHIAKGKLYIGASAGSMVIAPNIEYVRLMDDPAAAPHLDGDYSALAQVDFYVVPHFTNAPFRKAAKKIMAEYGAALDLRPISNHQAIAVKGDDVNVLSAPSRRNTAGK